MIDYVIGDKRIKDKVKRLEIRDKIDSDHQPVELWIKEEKWRREEMRREKIKSCREV